MCTTINWIASLLCCPIYSLHNKQLPLGKGNIYVVVYSIPPAQHFLAGCPSMGNPSHSYFPFWVHILATCDPSLNLFPLCIHLSIADILIWKICCPKKCE